MLTPRSEVMGDYETAKIFRSITGASFDFESLGQSLDCSRDFYGVGIIYSENNDKYIVRPPRTTNMTTYIVVSNVPHANYNSAKKQLQDAVTAPSLSKEITSAALSCGCLVLSVAAMIIGVGATPLSGGTSIGLTIFGRVAFAASATQCVNGIYRIYDIEENDSENVTWLDAQQWYQTTSTILDVISIVGVGFAFKDAVLTYRAMKAASSLKATNWLRLLPRHERARLTENIIRIKNPGISNKAIKAFIKAGAYPSRFPAADVQIHMQTQLINIINSAFALSGSAIGGVVRNPGNLIDTSDYVVGLIQSIEVL